jgi:para-aminobenzoate synthetase/4-amino-4-deoxychorismate lyase
MSEVVPSVRLDSSRPDGRSISFHKLELEVEARALGDVLPALAEVEAGVARGLHAAGFLTYEAAPTFDPHLAAHAPRPDTPLLWFGLFRERREHGPMPVLSDAQLAAPSSIGPFRPSTDRARYERDVARIQDWIAAGDSYQVNHTIRLTADFDGDEDALYARLAAAQRADFCAHIRLPGVSILSASPELFFRWTGGRLELRPMKGTRGRGRWPEEDDARAAELVASPKERAENLMIVDLLRNDAGRIAEFGTVRVPRLFDVERYPTVHQMTSTVEATTRPGTTLTDLLRALFPSGSVTGAPKVRTSEIIAELEGGPRGVYTGAIGFVSPGEAVFSVAIRTLLLDRTAGRVELGVGSGITADSEPGAEYRECLAKAEFARAVPRDFQLLESLRFQTGGGYSLLAGHLARIGASARYFNFPWDEGEVATALDAHGAGLGAGVHKVRLLLGRGGELAVESEPIAAGAGGRVRVGIAAEPVDESDRFLFHKTTLRGVYRDRAAAHPDLDDVLLVNRRGELTESTTSNLVVKLGGELFTPPLEAGLLPGVLRTALLADGTIRERTVRPDELRRAEAIYLINSVRGWREAELAEEGERNLKR